MRSIIELIDALDVRKRILIIGSAFVDVIVHVPRLPLSGEDVEGSSRQQDIRYHLQWKVQNIWNS